MSSPSSNGHAAPQPAVVQPSPVPTTWQVSAYPPGNPQIILVQIHAATGSYVTFMPPDFAKDIAAQIAAAAAQVSGGLILPPGVQFPHNPSNQEGPTPS